MASSEPEAKRVKGSSSVSSSDENTTTTSSEGASSSSSGVLLQKQLPLSLPRVCVLVSPTYNGDMDEIDPQIRRYLTGKVQMLAYDEARAAAAAGAPVEAILALFHPKIDEKLLRDLSPDRALRVVANYGVGVDHIDLKACAAHYNTPVTNTPGVLSGATADMAWALLMACARRIVPGDRYCRSEYNEYKNMIHLGLDVHGKTLGVIGMVSQPAFEMRCSPARGHGTKSSFLLCL